MNANSGANGVIAAIQAFGEAVDLQSFHAALDETLIEAVAESFGDDDAEVLELLGLIVRDLRDGKSPRQVAALLMQEESTAAASRRLQGRASTPDEAELKREWAHNAELRREFGQYESFAAYRRAHGEGLVKIVGGKRVV